MLKSTLLLTIASLAVIDAKQKHNTRDELLPSFNYFGYTDLDVLDFYTGAAERALGIDVREKWQNCFKVMSFPDMFQRFLNTGVIGWIPAVFWNFLIGQKDYKDLDMIVPDECHEITHEFDKMVLFERDNAIAPWGTFMYIYNAFTSVGKETWDIIDLV